MKQILMALALLGIVSIAHGGDGWNGVWRNADQQGEALLQQGNAKAAAATYADPQRKAYAQLKAGDYAAASHAYAMLSGNEARYNQGNALAMLGDLQAALAAYDAVLKNDPNNHDARHNRDLVANALKEQKAQQKPQQKPDDKKQNDKSKDNTQDQSREDKNTAHQDQGKSGEQTKPGEQGKPGDQKNSAANNPNANDKPGSENRQTAAQKSDQNGKPNDVAQSKSADNQALPPQGKAGAGPTPAKPQSQATQAENSALQDAMAGLDKDKGAAQPGAVSRVAGTPVTEQQIAQEQWLRAIPDDPGGLLRRKFLIEHMIRQQKEQP